MKKGWYWPWIVAALLVATAAGQGILFYAATHDASMAIEPDYYRKAVAWDAQRARDSVSAALGWTATGELRAPDSTGAEVAVRLADADGAPLGGARVRVAWTLGIADHDTLAPVRVPDDLRARVERFVVGAGSGAQTGG